MAPYTFKLFTDSSNRYLREIGDFDVCSEVVETAAAACVDKNSLLYARLKLIQGNIAFDLNRLTECRTAWDITKRIRTAKLPHDDPAGKFLQTALPFQRALTRFLSCFDLQQYGEP
jgi:hypothetical protein